MLAAEVSSHWTKYCTSSFLRTQMKTRRDGCVIRVYISRFFHS